LQQPTGALVAAGNDFLDGILQISRQPRFAALLDDGIAATIDADRKLIVSPPTLPLPTAFFS
jgi:hypothetical protein